MYTVFRERVWYSTIVLVLYFSIKTNRFTSLHHHNSSDNFTGILYKDALLLLYVLYSMDMIIMYHVCILHISVIKFKTQCFKSCHTFIIIIFERSYILSDDVESNTGSSNDTIRCVRSSCDSLDWCFSVKCALTGLIMSVSRFPQSLLTISITYVGFASSLTSRLSLT